MAAGRFSDQGDAEKDDAETHYLNPAYRLTAQHRTQNHRHKRVCVGMGAYFRCRAHLEEPDVAGVSKDGPE